MLRLKRIIVRYLDCLIILIIGLFVGYFMDRVTNINFSVIIISVLYIFKDLLFKNKSLFKKIFNLEILTVNREKPSFFKLIFRNVLSAGIINDLLIIKNNKTIGDYIFKTRVVPSVSKKYSKDMKYTIFALILVGVSIIPRIMPSNYLHPKYYDSITSYIPSNCNSRYLYIQSNYLFKSMKSYVYFECDGNIDLKFVDDLNFKKINTEEEIKKYEETLSYFKGKIENDDLFNLDFEFDIYNMKNLSNNYIIHSVSGNKIYVIISTDKK